MSHRYTSPYTVTRVQEELGTIISEAESKKQGISVLKKRRTTGGHKLVSSDGRVVLQRNRNMIVGCLGELLVTEGIHTVLLRLLVSVVLGGVTTLSGVGHDSSQRSMNVFYVQGTRLEYTVRTPGKIETSSCLQRLDSLVEKMWNT